MAYTLELLHFTDQEAGVAAVEDAPNLSAVLNALRAEDLGGDGEDDNTLVLSSGDAFIPGLFYSASDAVYGSPGIADIEIQNQLGVQAIAFGNHEFDFGPEVMADLISGDAEGTILGEDFGGTQFPYLSTNLDFSTEDAFDGLIVPGGGAPQGNVVSSSTVIEVNGEMIGVVGATTPTLASISSPGDVGISPAPFGTNPTPAELDALAAEIQAEVDALLAADPDLDKVVLLAHMQRISVEFELAERLEGVDIIVAGGSNTRLVDENDRLRPGDTDQGVYPTFFEGADGNPVAVVNTDGSYKYVGRLVVEFDEDGVLIPESYDPVVSGAYATDDEGVAALGAAGLVDPQVQQIADEIEAQIIATESNVFGIADVFLNGERSEVRTEETNLGNLTADANLATANALVGEGGEPVLVSIKNAGGIRASVGQAVVPPGGDEAVRLPGEEIPGVKPEGGVSQNDIETTLAFNNGLTLLTLTKAELVAVLEHGVAAAPEVAGQFPQVAGLEFSYDPALPEGERIQNAVIVDEAGMVLERLVTDGLIDGNPTETVRIVTLSFLADSRFDDDGNFIGGGDGYPFPNLNTDPAVGEVGDPDVIARVDRVDLAQDDDAPRTGDATFAPDGSEQDALAEYLDDNFGDEASAFDEADVGPADDARIQHLAFREDALLEDPAPRVGVEVFAAFQGEGGEGASEVVAYEDGVLFVTNGTEDRIDLFDLNLVAEGPATASIDLSTLPDYDGVQSVAVANGVVAAAVRRTPTVETVLGAETTLSAPGVVALYDAASLELLSTVEVGNLPDQLTFSADGNTLFVAGEGEKNADSEHDDNPLGTVAIIDVADPAAPAAEIVDFTAFNGLEVQARAAGIRIQPGVSFGEDVEPEYVALSPDGATAYVSLQENNALGVIDVASRTVVDVIGLGTTDFSQVALDPLDEGAIGIETFEDLVGFRMPDAIDTYEVDGVTYIVTANEGDSRDFDEARVADLVEEGALDSALVDRLLAAGAIDQDPDTDVGLERLEVSTLDGDTDGDGDIDELVAFNSRSFSIFDEDGTLVFDSQSAFELLIAEVAPERFNNDDGEPIAEEGDNRSDAKGPEPEAVEIGEIDGEVYAFIGLERDSGIAIYNITDPQSPYFVEYVEGAFVGSTPEGEIAAHAPEVITFISAEDSIVGRPQIAVSYEVSGTTFVYDLDFAADPVINEFDFAIASAGGLGGTATQVEVFGEGNTDYAGLWLVAVDSDAANAGTVLAAAELGATSPDGYQVLSLPLGEAAAGSHTVFILEDFTGSVGDDFDTDNDGVPDNILFTRVVDDVAFTDGDGGDLPYSATVLPLTADGDDAVPGESRVGVSRIPNGVDTDSEVDWLFRTADTFTPSAPATLGAENELVGIRDTAEGVVVGTFAPDSITGGSGADDFSGEGGNDSLSGGGGADVLRGGADDDVVLGGNGADSVTGNEGDDFVSGGGGADDVNGADGDDFVQGDGGDDFLVGGTGDDTGSGGAGNDRFTGQAGADVFGGANGNDTGFGGSGEDALYGENGDDDLAGGAGDDSLAGAEGDDRLRGNDGDDLVVGGVGDDRMNGGAGADSLSGQAGEDVARGGEGADTLAGGQDADDLDGGDGFDEVKGNAGDDSVSGGNGRDSLFGNGGDDVLDGGQGIDVLEGGRGNDVLTGGSGADTFRFEGVFGDDVVTDFDVARDLFDFVGVSEAEVALEETASGTLVVVSAAATSGTIQVEGVALADLEDVLF